MNPSKFKLITILTVLLLGLNSWPADLNSIRENNSSSKENAKSVGNHAPISIDGNDALSTFIEDEGLSGDGTYAAPYIIENFVIDGSTIGMGTYGIEIQSTDAYLIIRDCTVEGSSWIGIVFDNAKNVNISNNTANNNMWGILLQDSCNNNTLFGNTANNNEGYGIHLAGSYNNILSGNTATNNSSGISLGHSSNNTLSGNTASNNSQGIIMAYSSNNNILTGNIATNNVHGISLGFYSPSSTNTIYFNDIYGNTYSQASETEDSTDNHWDNGTTGNYWGDDYINNYPSATNDGTIWSIPYEINGTGSGIDHFPLVNSITTPTTTDDTTPTTTPSWNVLLILLSFIAMLPLRWCKKET
ncbi:MAG: right-handed parallel beta-helix repeat-containing protein [Candidatus Hodarchaeales archaeon]